MLKEMENAETRLFCHIFIICGISIGGGALSPPLAMPMIVTSMLFVMFRFCVFLLVCPQNDTNGFILYDHAKYVILFVIVKIVLNSNCF